MNSRQSRTLLWAGIICIIIIAFIYSFWPRAIVTDIAPLTRGELRISISEEGETRIHDIYVLSAPVAGYLRRIEIEVGDRVYQSDTVVASIEPIDPAFLDPRSEAQAKAEVDAANSSTQLARASVSQAQAELDFAQSELGRMRDLATQNSVSQRELDNAQRAFKTRRASLETAQASLQMRLFELERAKAVLMSPATASMQHGQCDCVDIIAPINGRVLKVINESEGVITAGMPLLEIGDPQNLEVVVELLSFDAVKTQPGQTVYITNWGGKNTLVGKISRVEPIGFEKISALGIEEQRVNVIVSLLSEFSTWQRLGHGYQLDVEIVLSESTDVLKVPITALFREKQQWAIYAVVDGRAEKRHVEIGRINHFDAEILAGLSENDLYVLHPNDQIHTGTRVSQRFTESN